MCAYWSMLNRMNMLHAVHYNTVLATTQIRGDPKFGICDLAVYIHFTLVIAWFDNLTQKLACTPIVVFNLYICKT